MAINPNNGVLDIVNGVLKVSSIDIKESGGFATAINTVARNDVLLYDDQHTNTTFLPAEGTDYRSTTGVSRDTYSIDLNDGWVYWPLKLPNSWHAQFDMRITATGGVFTFSLFNTSTPNHTDYTANDGGYKIVFDNTNNQIDVYWEGSVHATASANVRSTDWQHVNINYFRGAVSVSLAGKVVLNHGFTENYQEADSRYIGFSATSGTSHEIRNLAVHNSDKWLYTKTSNASDITYVSGNVGIGTLTPTELLDVHGNVHIAKDLTVNGNLTVSGTTTFIDTQNLAIEDPIIEVARGNASDTIDAGLVITRATSNVAVAYRGDEEELALGYTQSGASDTDVTPITDGGLDVRVYGNLFANNLTTTANVEATYLKGDGSEITHVTLDQVVGYGNVTSNTIQLTNADVGLKATGNVEANYFVGNGSKLTGLVTDLQSVTDNGNTTSNTVQFTNATTALIADSNVGIGTDAPTADLHVAGYQYVNDPPTLANSFDHSDAPLTLTHSTPTSTTAIDDPKAVLHLTRDGTSGESYGARASFNLSRYENSSTHSRSRLDVALADGTYAETNVMSIRADGKVGIGTTAPAYTLDVAGDINLSGDFYQGGSPFVSSLWTSGNDSLYYRSNVEVGTGNLFVDTTTSNVGIGTSTPGYTLDVHGTANVGALTATSVSGNGSALFGIQSSNVSDFASNVTRITTLETDLGSNATRIGTLETDLGSNATRIGTLETDLGSNATRIGTLETDLGSNATRIGTLETDLGSNATRIGTLETDLGSNATRIGTLESGDHTFTGIKTFENDVILESNLRVQGDLLVVNTVNLTVSDPIIELGSNNSGTNDLGIIMTRPNNNSNVAVFFDESADALKLGYTLNGANDTVVDLDSNALAVSIQGALSAASVSGDGSGLTSLNASNITTGALSTTSVTIDDYLIHDGDTDTKVGFPLADTFAVNTAGSERLRVDSSGLVGIGTSSPGTKLNMKGGVFLAENQASTNGQILYGDGGGTGGNNNSYTIANAKFGTGVFVNDTGTTGSTITLVNKEGANNVTKHASIGFVNTDTTANGKFGGQIGFWPEDTNASKQQFRIYTSGAQAGYNLPVQRMVVNGDGNVGIGTTDADYKLHIRSGTATALLLESDNGGTGYPVNIDFRNYDAQDPPGARISVIDDADYGSDITFNTKTGSPGTGSLSQRMIIQGDGNVGIGTTSPAATLDIRGAVADPSTPTVHIGDNSADAGDYGMVNLVRDGTNGGSKSHLAFIRSGHSALGMGFHNNTNTWGIFPSFSSVTNTPAMAITSDGNVGIGTASPMNKLDVRSDNYATFGKATYNAAGWSGIRLGTPHTTNHDAYCSVIESYNNHASDYNSILRFKTSNGNNAAATERMRITAAGNVGIGTASPGYKFDVNGTSYYRSRMYLHQSGSGGGQNLFTGLGSVTSANGRAQFVLSSAYSDLVIASSQANDNHGSTLSFVTYNPSNAADYRKFVINQGNWGSRKQFLDFGYADLSYANPHGYINSTDTVLTLDGINKRVGIGATSPVAKLHVNGDMRVGSSTNYMNFGSDGVMYHGTRMNGSTETRFIYLGMVNTTGTSYYMVNAGSSSSAVSWDGYPGVWSSGNGEYRIHGNGASTTCAVRADGGHLTFTGSHDTFTPFSEEDVGKIVCSTGEYSTELKNGVMYNELTVMDSCPIVTLATKDNDKRVMGVLSRRTTRVETERISEEEYDALPNKTNYEKLPSESNVYTRDVDTGEFSRGCYNAVGEGGIWVTNKNGVFENGDYIVSSTIPGYGQKQNDDLLHNYTVSKITGDCDFTDIPVVKQKHISVNGYYQYTENGEPMREHILDENGNTITFSKFKLRYLLPDGTQITKEEYELATDAYIAAFVGCTYHCG